MRYLRLFVACLIAPVISAQTPTSPPTNAASTYNGLPLVWQPYSNVTVYIDGTAFPAGSAQETARKKSFKNDENAYYANDGVTYSFVNIGSSAPSLKQNTLYVTTANLPTPAATTNNTGTLDSIRNYICATSSNASPIIQSIVCGNCCHGISPPLAIPPR